MTTPKITPCVSCQEPTTETTRGRIGDTEGPLCADCQPWCDGNTAPMTTPRITTTAHTVTVLPEGHSVQDHLWSITVQRRGPDSWAVLRHDGKCLSRDGGWDHEALNRTDQWLTAHRFTEPEALKLAAHWAPLIEVNGRTAAQFAEQR